MLINFVEVKGLKVALTRFLGNLYWRLVSRPCEKLYFKTFIRSSSERFQIQWNPLFYNMPQAR